MRTVTSEGAINQLTKLMHQQQTTMTKLGGTDEPIKARNLKKIKSWGIETS